MQSGRCQARAGPELRRARSSAGIEASLRKRVHRGIPADVHGRGEPAGLSLHGLRNSTALRRWSARIKRPEVVVRFVRGIAHLGPGFR